MCIYINGEITALCLPCLLKTGKKKKKNFPNTKTIINNKPNHQLDSSGLTN